MGKSSLNNGSCMLVRTTAPGVPADRRRLDLVVYGATPRQGALCCDATLVAPTRSSAAEDRKSPWFWARRSAGAGMARLAASCSTSSASGRKELSQLSATRPPRAGRAVGGAYWLLPCSRPSPARHWGRLGQCRSTRVRGMNRPSSECSSSPDQQRPPVACRCARSGRR